MYTACLFCHAALGRNEAVEAFPVGRRLAYDEAMGRLWVVCRRCERWNLTPLEERWEAIEQAERLYRATRLRASTDNVGLARLRDGTELVRVGHPPRPEFAAWRYGDQFGRRRRRQLLVAAGGAAAVGAVLVGGASAGVSIGGFGWLFSQAFERIVNGSPEAVVARIATPHGVLHVKRKHLARTSIVRGDAGPFGLRLARRRGDVTLEGDDAVRAAALLLPAVNRYGGSRLDVAQAVTRIEAAGGADALVGALARDDTFAATSPDTRVRSRWASGDVDRTRGLFGLGKVTRLALEMALHEEQERRAIAGELAPLERAWREAEEIAAIADGLVPPRALEARLDQLRARSSARAGAPSSPTSDSGAASSS